MTTCSERVKNVYRENVNPTQSVLFDKLDSFGIEYTNEQTLLKNLAIFDFESITVQKKASKIPIQQKGLESLFPSRFLIPQIL